MRRTLFLLLLVGGCGGDNASTDDGETPLPDRAFTDDAGSTEGGGGPPPGNDGGSTTGKDAEAGTTDGAVGCEGTAACPRVVFFTKDTFVGNNLGGLDGADAKCQTVADKATSNAVKGRKFVAWLSTSTVAVKDRMIHGTMAYKKPSGTVVATDWNDLTDGTLASAINEDENGTTPANALPVWTGSTTAGGNGPNQCDSWGPTGNQGAVGATSATNQAWTNVVNIACSQAEHLYCFEK